jgi:exopolyphosphatase/pppGpp-phosphohydrolase
MPRKCSICVHEKRGGIEQSLVSGDSYRDVALRFKVSRDAVARHRKHLVSIVAKSSDSGQITQSENLLAQLEGLKNEAQRLKQKAERAGDYRAALAAVRELCRIVELVAKLCGQMDSRTETRILNVNLDPETISRITQTFLARHRAENGELSS